MPAATTTAPPQDDEGYLSLHNHWFTSGWMQVLPRHQAMMLTMLFGTAMVRQLKGSLDDITAQIFGDDLKGGLSGLGDDGLDSALLWLEDDELEEADSPEEAAQLRADAPHTGSGCRRRCARLPFRFRPRSGNWRVPWRDSGSYSGRRGGGGWSMPSRLPLPENVLALPDDVLGRLQGIRYHQAIGPAEQALLSYFADTLGQPDSVSTSLERLERATGSSADELRAALDYLADTTLEIKLNRGEPPMQLRAHDLATHTRFRIVMDWLRINDNRIRVVRGD